MMPSNDQGERLAAAVARLASEPATTRVADALRLWLEAGDGVTLESCLGLGPTWRSTRRRWRRDRLYERIALEHFRGLSGSPLAHAIRKAISDYESRSWQRDRRSGNRRSGLPGLIFDLLQLGAPLLSHESIRALVGKNNPSE
jgi:hypothetical protein